MFIDRPWFRFNQAPAELPGQAVEIVNLCLGKKAQTQTTGNRSFKLLESFDKIYATHAAQVGALIRAVQLKVHRAACIASVTYDKAFAESLFSRYKAALPE